MLDDTMIDAEVPRFDPVPALPATPTPGRPGDFAFLDGDWRIRHLKRRGDRWDRFEGRARCWSILGGVGHVEELLIPARDFSGLELRMLDVTKKEWSDHWVNAKSGVVTTPGQTGSFEQGAGLFASSYEENGKPMQSIGIWDRIGDGLCRWRQVWSADGGATWQHDWVMHWRRVKSWPSGARFSPAGATRPPAALGRLACEPAQQVQCAPARNSSAPGRRR